ncbi:cytochrome P450 2J4-like [Haliotis asinina]|uniref:cytochrome P450 2J4-like n=1 Tax=Haliotis asinina TaxID=109174 RepID=UPI003531A8E6
MGIWFASLHMSINNWILAVVVIIVLAFLVTLLNDIYTTYVKGLPPGPWSLPVIGGLYMLNPRQPHISMEKLIQKYGKMFTVQFGFLGPTVFICDSALPYKVYSHNLPDRPSLPVFKYLNRSEEGIGSIQYSPCHRQLRRMCLQAMNNIDSTSIQHHTNKAFKIFFQNLAMENPVDPKKDIIKMTTALFATYIYGLSYQNFEDPVVTQLCHNQQVILSVLFPGHPFNILPWTIHITSKWSKQFITAVKERDSILQRQYSLLDSPRQTNTTPLSVLGHMAAMRHQHPDKSSMEAIKMSCWTKEVAGMSTTQNSIQWLMLYLAINPDVQDRAVALMKSVVPVDRMPTLADKPQLPYIEAIVMEVLRIAPPVPLGIPHTSLQHTISMESYTLPKGTMALCNIWHIHHNEKYWKKPNTFKPERFIGNNGKCIPHHKLKHFLPFGHGKRSCVGENVARNILFLFTCALLKCTRLLIDDCEIPDMNGFVTLGLEPFPHKLNIRLQEHVDLNELFTGTTSTYSSDKRKYDQLDHGD